MAQTDQPIRIVRIVTRLNIGGPALHVAILSNQLDPKRFSTCLVIGQPEEGEGDLQELIDSRVKVIRLRQLKRPIRPWQDAVAFIRLLGILWKQRPRIIHTHMAKAGTLGRLAGLCYNAVGPGRFGGPKAKLVHTFHGHVLEGYFSGWSSRFFVKIEQWLGRRTDCLIAVSPKVQDELLKHNRIAKQDQWRVVPLGLHLKVLETLPLPAQAASVRAGLVGRLVPIKNPELFLNGIARASQAADGMLEANVVGDGPLRAGLEKQARALGLEPVLRFAGWQRDIPSVYRQLDIVCITSWNEGTPVSMIEAMAAGRAVIATDVGGVRDVLEEKSGDWGEIPQGQYRLTERGVLVRPGDLEAFQSALVVLAGDFPLRQKLGKAAREAVIRKFDQSRLVQDMTDLYQRLNGEQE